MNLPLAFVVGMMVLIGCAIMLVEIRLRLITRRFNARLESLDARIQGWELPNTSSSPSEKPRAMASHGEPVPTSSLRRRVDRPSASSIPGPSLIAIPDLATERSVFDTTFGDELEGRYREIWTRGDLGVPPREIARESGLPLGQVELILGLRRLVRPATSEPGVQIERGAP